jgi:hypothetical protein
MPETRSIYRGHEIIFGGTDEAPTLTIDGQTIGVTRVGPDFYVTPASPHEQFPTLDALARGVVDHSSFFHLRRDAH